ncbi:uncharacterized protein EDB91DRAFT_1086533 [Suillus paluster]|uniref:uncharacterized protein n=1 Tax=Suillus paluster TaxID=48578 RepID=UPI001B874147|nr:uncharacterized protein EDB91DRAFT_1086533 [Suillus paluster]KAG1727059.1 hypothetical protein EDB91DRAFT_1086533 [Suillus paluster]
MSSPFPTQLMAAHVAYTRVGQKLHKNYHLHTLIYFPIKALVDTTLVVASVCTQNAYVNQPAPGSSNTAGANFTVQIGMADTATSFQEIAIVIAIQSCPTGNCFPVTPPNQMQAPELAIV